MAANGKTFFYFFVFVVCSSFTSATPLSPPCEEINIPEPGLENIVQSPNYKVHLDNCGPKARLLSVLTVPTVEASAVELSPVVLPYKVPAPMTVSNNCKCVKTIVKPQVLQRVITVPVIRKYVQTLAQPAYEVINYTAEPVNCPKIEAYAENCL